MNQASQERQSSEFITNISEADLQSLRSDLLHAGLDSWQAGELISSFLVARGFGVSSGDARKVATMIEAECCSLEYMRQALTTLAFVM